MKNAVLTLTLLLMTSPAWAEAVGKIYPPPKVPLVARAPANGAWTAKLQSPSNSKKDKRKPAIPTAVVAVITEIKTTQTGRLKLEEVIFSDNRRVQNWYVEGKFIFTGSSNDKIIAAVIEPDWDRTNLTVPTGFTGFTWIKKEDFLEVGKFERKPAYHYKRTSIDGSILEAWVDCSSNLPLAFRICARTYVYSFESNLPAPLVLPEPFQKVEQKIKAGIEYHKLLDRDLEPAR